MTPKLYQIIPGGELTADQFQLVKEFFPEQENQFVYRNAFYFSGERFLEVWSQG